MIFAASSQYFYFQRHCPFLCTVFSVAIALLQGSGYLQLSAKKASPLGRYTRFGGNVVGGLLIGFGMALSGACPGTVLIQAVQSIPSGIYATLGSFLGGAAYFGLRKVAPIDPPPQADLKSPSVATLLKISPFSALTAYEAICISIIVLSKTFNSLSSGSWPLGPILGGVLIGGAQLFSLLLRRSSLGVSTVFGDVPENIVKWFQSNSDGRPRPYAWDASRFAAGFMAGSWLLTTCDARFALRPGTLHISPLNAILGGFLMSIGSRHAGGCTSGHGLSGTAQLSVSSFITTISMFAGGIGLATFL